MTHTEQCTAQQKAREETAQKIQDLYFQRGATVDISSWNETKRILNTLLTEAWNASREALVGEIGKMEKDFQVQSDGQYHFGENQKTIGYNAALTDITSLIRTNKEV